MYLQGEVDVRFANECVSRMKSLHRAGLSDVNLVELPKAMSKLEALQYLQEQGITQGDAGYSVAIKVAEKTKLAKKGEIKVKATGVKTTAKAADKSAV